MPILMTGVTEFHEHVCVGEYNNDLYRGRNTVKHSLSIERGATRQNKYDRRGEPGFSLTLVSGGVTV